MTGASTCRHHRASQLPSPWNNLRMPFSITPTAYINMLRAIPVSLPDGSATRIAIRNYRCELECNGGSKAGKQFIRAVHDSARRLHLQLDSNTTTIDHAIAAQNAVRARQAQRAHRAAPAPVQPSNLLDMTRAANGKANIQQFRSVLTNLGTWLFYDGAFRLGNIAWEEKPSYWGRHEGQRYIGAAFVEQLQSHTPIARRLQLIADTFFGLDCNGFVGTWLQMNGQNRNSESSISDMFTEAEAIEHVRQISPYMLIRFEDDRHINIIETAGHDENHWNVSGAEFNGIGTSPYTIHEASGHPKRFRVAGGGMASPQAMIGPAERGHRR